MQNTKSSDSALQPLPPEQAVGQILSNARANWDLTAEEVADNLNLSADTIRALERDDYSNLPGVTFIKGYLRSYAVLLRLDPQEIIAKANLKPEKLSEILSTTHIIKQIGKTKTKQKTGWFFKFLCVFLLLIALGLFGWYQWSKLDTAKLAEFFKFPISETVEEDSPDITFPDSTSKSTEKNQQKEALIRIE